MSSGTHPKQPDQVSIQKKRPHIPETPLPAAPGAITRMVDCVSEDNRLRCRVDVLIELLRYENVAAIGRSPTHVEIARAKRIVNELEVK